MRYAALQLIITYVDMTVAYDEKYPLNDSHLKTIKGRGYKLTKEVDGMLMMDGNKSRGYNKFVLIPETHPAFNGGMMMDSDAGVNIRKKLKKALTNIVKRAFFTA